MIIDVKGDGNCLFRCVAMAMEGREHNYRQYRQMCIDEIEKNKDLFRNLITRDKLKQTVDDGSDIVDQYVEMMRKDRQMGGQIELQALSLALGVMFLVEGLGNKPIEIGLDKDAKNSIQLVRRKDQNGEGHYQLIKELRKKKDLKNRKGGIGRSLQHAIRIIYPLVQTLKYLKKKDHDGIERVLKYWCINWLLSLVEWLLPFILNDVLISAVQIVLAIGMVVRRFQLAQLVFDNSVQPIIKSNEQNIGRFFNIINSTVKSLLSKVWNKESKDKIQSGVTDAVIQQLKKQN